MSVTLDGNPCFGVCVKVAYSPNANAQQLNQFFGVNGRQTLFGGTRGSTFMITGALVGDSLDDLNAAEANLLGFADGQTHQLTDNRGRTFNNVVFAGEYDPDPQIYYLAGGEGVMLRYKCVLMGMIV
jgi:hypothetical protein